MGGLPFARLGKSCQSLLGTLSAQNQTRRGQQKGVRWLLTLQSHRRTRSEAIVAYRPEAAVTDAADPTQAWTVYSCDFGVYTIPKTDLRYSLAVR